MAEVICSTPNRGLRSLLHCCTMTSGMVLRRRGLLRRAIWFQQLLSREASATDHGPISSECRTEKEKRSTLIDHAPLTPQRTGRATGESQARVQLTPAVPTHRTDSLASSLHTNFPSSPLTLRCVFNLFRGLLHPGLALYIRDSRAAPAAFLPRDRTMR